MIFTTFTARSRPNYDGAGKVVPAGLTRACQVKDTEVQTGIAFGNQGSNPRYQLGDIGSKRRRAALVI